MADSLDYKDMQIQLTDLGAIILNSDGTMMKIDNWHELTEHEQGKALRVIAKRNAKRKAQLEAQQREEGNTDNGVSVGNKPTEAEEESGEVLAIENGN
jgi:hypothetical protein